MTLDSALAAPTIRHLEVLTGPFGLYEHALMERPRQSCGYTTDDNGGYWSSWVGSILIIPVRDAISRVRPDRPGAGGMAQSDEPIRQMGRRPRP